MQSLQAFYIHINPSLQKNHHHALSQARLKASSRLHLEDCPWSNARSTVSLIGLLALHGGTVDVVLKVKAPLPPSFTLTGPSELLLWVPLLARNEGNDIYQSVVSSVLALGNMNRK